MPSPIQYTSRDYDTILNDINAVSALADKPEWFKRYIAGLGDILDMYLNATANQSFLRTAFTRQAVADLCENIDYYLTAHSTSSGTLLVYLNAATVAFPKTIALADLIAQSQGSLLISSKRFEARAASTMASTSEAFTTNFAVNSNLTVARTYMTGEKVRVSTSNTLPAPLVSSTDYWVIYVNATTIRLATSLANAYLGTYITLTSDGVGVHTITLYSMQVSFYQQTTISSSVLIGNSDGTTSWQKFNLQDNYILRDTITLTINSLAWTRVDSLINSISTDRNFVLRYNSDGSSFVLFGNGTYGAIPGNFPIYAMYSYGGGSTSNISSANRINTYAGSDTDVTGVSNPAAFTGGEDEETIASAKVVAPMLLKARDRFVTVDDGEFLAESYPGVSIAKCNPNVYGLLSSQFVIVPDGGGLPSAPLKTALDTYLTDRCILASIDIRVIDPTYVATSITAQIKLLTGYIWATVQGYAVLAFRLLFSEITKYFLDDYDSNGIISVVAKINTKWSTSFAAADYTQIQTLLENVESTEFGKSFYESDVLSFIQSYVSGVDYLTISVPAAWPITTTVSEITQDNINPANITQI